MQNPIDRFRSVWRDARQRDTLQHRNAVCVSTIDEHGYPNSRFVDLKDVDATGFVFCTDLESGKALDIERNPRVGLALWWEPVAMQVRAKGLCQPLSSQEANAYWAMRPRAAQLATAAFAQSRPLADTASLAKTYARVTAEHDGMTIPRPGHWGGFRLQAQQIEFLEFRDTRLHVRTCYERIGEDWRQSFLQP